MHNPSGISPVDLRILVKPDAAEEVSKGGVIIPQTTQEKQQYATVKGTLVARGPNAFKEWGSDNEVPTGARVLIAQYAGSNITGADGEKYRIMNDADLCAVLEGDQ